MAWLRRLWRSRDWMLIPLGGAVIVAAAIFALGRWGWFERESGYWAPRFGLYLVDLSYADRHSEPTIGMRFAASIYGSVTHALPVRARMVDPRMGQGTISGRAHDDVAGFIRAWPQASLIDHGSPAETSHLALNPEDFATGGRLILRDGCLRIVKQGWNEERLVVPFGPIDLFRDPEGYLAIGAFEGPEETRLRIGEPGGLLQVMPVRDSQLAGVAQFRELCGEAPIVLLHSAKRLPDCSGEYLAAEEERQRGYRSEHERHKSAAAACRERAAAAPADASRTPCPPSMPPAPPVPPPPPDTGGSGVCRHPDVPVPDTPKAL